MTVAELIDLLEDMDSEARVMIVDENGEYADLESLDQGYLEDDEFQSVDTDDVSEVDHRELVLRLATA